MKAIDRQTRKLNLISRITHLNDDNLIDGIEKFLNQNSDIPDWQKKELDKRWSAFLKNPDSAIDVNQAFEELDKELS
jgi:hypothetical protein